ncbi:MAG: hypothetical protein ACFFDH_01315 [Promethearchaeota archaeon]
MNLKKKIQVISRVLYICDNNVSPYCGNIFIGNLKGNDFDSGYHANWYPVCNEIFDPNDNWKENSLIVIDKIIHDEKLQY